MAKAKPKPTPKPATKAKTTKNAEKPQAKALYKEKPLKPAAAPKVATTKETDEQKRGVIAKLVADHGYTYETATAIVNNSKPVKKSPSAVKPEDEYRPAVTVSFAPRAGAANYREELELRAQDVKDEVNRVFYIVPVRLSKKHYNFLIQDTLQESIAAKEENWTEQNHIEMLLNERMALSPLTTAENKH